MGSSYARQYQSMAQESIMFPSMASMQAALPNFGMPSMAVTGSGMNAYPIQWSQQGEVVQLQTSYPLSVEGSSNGQHMATSIPQMMQHGMDQRITGNFFNMPNQSDVSTSYISSKRNVSAQYISFQNSSYEVSDPNVKGNLSSQFPFHKISVNMPGGNSTNTDSFYVNPGQWQQWLMSQHSAGSSGIQPPPQGSFYFNTQSSDGNPFG